MKWQVLCLVLCCTSAQALHATRPLVAPSKLIAKPGADGRLRAKARACHAQQSKDKCLQSACVYCSSPHHGVSSGCYHPLESLRMPKNVFQCAGSKEVMESAQKALQRAKLAGVNFTDPCEGKTDQAACDALDECTWCKSAAVASSCYTRAQSKRLPPAVFQCDKPAPTSSERRERRKATFTAAVAAGRMKRRAAGSASQPTNA